MFTDQDFIIARPWSNKEKGIILMQAWMDAECFHNWKQICQEVKKKYYIVGITPSLTALSEEQIKYGSIDNGYDLIICPNASFAYNIMSSAFLNVNNSFYPIHENTTKSFLHPELPKEYDACIVMNMNKAKMWGPTCDLIEEKQDHKFVACVGKSVEGSTWTNSRTMFFDRLRSLPNLTLYADGIPYSEVITNIAKSKMLLHMADFDTGPFSVTEALATDVPVLFNIDSSSFSRHLIKNHTGLFCRLSDIFDRFDLMIDLIAKKKFQPRQWYIKNYGFKNFHILFRKLVKMYGLGNPDTINIMMDEKFGANCWFGGKLYSRPLVSQLHKIMQDSQR